MQFYQAKVRLAGSLMNEVFKAELSAPEIMLLREFHGQDAVVDIKRTREEPVPSEDERERLMGIYMGSSNNDPEQIKAKQMTWMRLFGHAGASLPSKLPGEYPLADPSQEANYTPKPPVRKGFKKADPEAENPLE